MLVVLVVLLAVLALVLLMLLLQTRAALASTRDAHVKAELERDDAIGRATDLDEEIVRLETEQTMTSAALEELERGLGESEERAEVADARLTDLQTEHQEAIEAVRSLESSLASTTRELEGAEQKIEEQTTTLDSATAEILDLTHQTEQLQAELVEAADEAARQRTPSVPSVLVSDDGAGLDVSGFSPGMAWELELVRSERTWRYSVAANPVEDPSPFESADNPLKLAIEIEALALREDVGAFIGIDWLAGDTIHPEDDPARAHLTLRLAQELLASAAREMSPSTLIVRPDAERGGVSLEVVASDPDDVDFKIPPPPVASEWIGIDEHGGMVVTIKVDTDS